ncbi:MAG TPA: hypothetical protein VGG72_33150 [Bryobacteraceae bacterium]
MTECYQGSFEFQAHFSRPVTAQFDGGRRLKLLPRLGQCFLNGRDAARTHHCVAGGWSSRECTGCHLGYEDRNSREQLGAGAPGRSKKITHWK